MTRLSCAGLVLGYGRGRAPEVGPVDLEIPDGAVVGLVGESGSGKTTLLRGLLGFLPPVSGSVSWGGVPLGTLSGPQRRAFRRSVQPLSQEPREALNPRQTGRSALREVLSVHGVPPPLRGSVDPVAELAGWVGLPESVLDRPPRTLSGGEAQRVALARALAAGPEILLLDEPLSALDWHLRRETLALLSRLVEERGLGVLLVSHDLGAVSRICQQVHVLSGGRIVESGTPGDLRTNPAAGPTRRLVEAAAWEGLEDPPPGAPSGP